MSFERCPNPTCDYEQRLEYCTPTAGHPGEIAEMVVDKIQDVLNASSQVASSGYASSVDESGIIIERQFNYLHGDFKGWVWPLTETTVAINALITRRPYNERYTVAVGWQIQSPKVIAAPLQTVYTIDVFNDGAIQSNIDRPLIAMTSFEDAAASDYELRSLYSELDVLAELHKAEYREHNSKNK